MLVVIFSTYEIIIINEILMPGVVRGIYVDNVDFTGVGVGEGSEGFEVVALD